jgi:UDP-N-acetyl-D-glucosamine dehydrogenase
LKLTLKERLTKVKDVRIAIVGVGYIGLPLAIRFTEEGFSVIGNDVNSDVIEKLSADESTIEGISDKQLRAARRKGMKLISIDKDNPSGTDLKTLELFIGVDVFIICVPTPLDPDSGWEPDTSYIKKACGMIKKICQLEAKAKKLPEERLVVLESTTYPGTTKEIFSSLLNSFSKHGRQWYLAYSPERTSPGLNAYKDKRTKGKAAESSDEHHLSTFQITRIVGGIDEKSKEVVEALYNTIFSEVRAVSNLETAEMIKLIENTFRFTSIAFANEMAIVAKTMGLDIWEIIDAARTKKFGFELCFPGLIGGHCLPIDPHYLSSATRKRRLSTTFVDEAERAHQNMRREAFDVIQRLLNQQDRGISGASILFFGISYKKNVGDIRESAALRLMEKLYASGANLSFWDPVRARHPAKPHIRLVFTREEYEALPKALAEKLTWDRKKRKFYIEPEEVEGDWKEVRNRVFSSTLNCVVLATDHDEFRSAYADIMSNDAPPIADLSNAINSWLRDAALRKGKEKKIREQLADRRKYMLLCVH